MKTLVIDVGGTYIKYGLIDEKLKISEAGKVEAVKTSIEDYLNVLVNIYNKLKENVDGVGFSMPGIINCETGYIHIGGAYNDIVHDINLKKELEKRIDVPIAIANDAKCAAFAELGFGNLKDVDDGIMYVIGTGIGGCLISGKKILQGKRFASGEFSSVVTNSNDELDANNSTAMRCGYLGLVDYVKEEYQIERNFSGEEIFELVLKGEEKAKNALRKYCKQLAISFYNLQAIFDPEKICVGGGISKQPILFEYINEELDEICVSYNNVITKPQIVQSYFNNDANLIGAYYNLKEHLEKN